LIKLGLLGPVPLSIYCCFKVSGGNPKLENVIVKQFPKSQCTVVRERRLRIQRRPQLKPWRSGPSSPSSCPITIKRCTYSLLLLLLFPFSLNQPTNHLILVFQLHKGSNSIKREASNNQSRVLHCLELSEARLRVPTRRGLRSKRGQLNYRWRTRSREWFI